MTSAELQRLADIAKQQESEDARKREYDAAAQRCAELVRQEYWERPGLYRRETMTEVGMFAFLRITKLTPAWWGAIGRDDGSGNRPVDLNELRIGGTVCLIWLPLLPVFVKTGDITQFARGPYGVIPQYQNLVVKRTTTRTKPELIPLHVSIDNQLVVPLTVSAAPIPSFSERLNWFDGLTPSTPERFRKGVETMLDYCRAAQALLPEETQATLAKEMIPQ